MKLSNLKTKIIALVLTAALCLAGLITAPNKAEAATNYVTLLSQEGDAAANTPVSHTFNIPNSSRTYINVFTPQPADLTCIITSAGNEKIYEETVVSTDTDIWQYSTELNAYNYYVGWPNPLAGDYTISLTFGADIPYIIYIDQDAVSIKMSSSSLILTKGFSSKLTVADASGKVKWTSSKSSVASVNSSGKVTAKKAGSATITATDANGSSAKCVVTVKANVFTAPKLTTQQVTFGNGGLDVHKMSYDSKGNLVIQANFLNNTGKKVVKLNKYTITVKSPSKKTIGTYTLSTKDKNVSIPQGGTKTFKFTIKKSKLKIKTTQDLRNSYAVPKGSFYVR